MRLGNRRLAPIVVGLCSAGAFIAISAIRLEAQGMYYDEVHQAPAAFAWVGKHPPFFALLSVWGLPLLNMTYSSAIKSAIFGLWMAITELPFHVCSWRLLGIGLGALGVATLGIGGGRTFPTRARVLLSLLVISDVSLLVMCRHDWGPVALGFLLRALFVVAWIGAETTAAPGSRYAFWMGAMVGLAVSEKLSSVVLLVPLGLALASSPRLRTRPKIAVALAGLMVGVLPLIFVNLVAIAQTGRIISLADVGHRTHSGDTFAGHLLSYVSQAAGDQPLGFVLGVSTPRFITAWQTTALCLAMAAIAFSGLRSKGSLGRIAAVSAISWMGIGVALWLLPKQTWAHHWIIGTPFQYAALSLAVAEWFPRAAGEPVIPSAAQVRRILIAGCVTVVLLAGLCGVLNLDRALVAGAHSSSFSPDLTTVGEFAGRQGPEAVFIAADWGIATQIYCLSNGRDGIVHEVFWDYQGPESLQRIIAPPDVRSFYLVRLDPASNVAAESTRRAFSDAATLAGWHEAVSEGGLGGLRAVAMRRYDRD